MNNIEKLTGRILADARKEAAQIIADGETRAAALLEETRSQLDREARGQEAHAAQAAAAQLSRLQSAAQLEAGKRLLREKQRLVDEAFRMAMDKLTGLSEEESVEFLAALAADAAENGRGQVYLSPSDRQRVGVAVCDRANALLRAAGKPDQLVLADGARPIQGGVIVVNGRIETNCSAEVLLGALRQQMAGEVAGMLLG